MVAAVRWDTGVVGQTHRRTPVSWIVVRGILLAAVLAGLFAMHVLTADHETTGHGVMPMIAVAGQDGMVGHGGTNESVSVAGDDGVKSHGQARGGTASSSDPTETSSGAGAFVIVEPVDPAPDSDHGGMAGCILFLVIGGAAVLLALVLRRQGLGFAGFGGLAGAALTDIRRRGPPGHRPRLALCVIRV